VISIILALVDGFKPNHSGMVIVAIALAILLISAVMLTLWATTEKLGEGERPKYCVYTQMVALVVISAALLAVINAPTDPDTYLLGGSASGIMGGALSLQLNGDETISVSGGGSCVAFNFGTQLSKGSKYSVAIRNQPTQSFCQVLGGSGSVKGNTLSIAVSCKVTIGGTVDGLTKDSMDLQNESNGLSGVDRVTVLPTNRTFTFPQLVAVGSSYKVTIAKPPVGQSCVISPSTAEGVAYANVLTVSVTCN